MGGVRQAIDLEKLSQLLGTDVAEGITEKYQFTWPDKKKATRMANAPTNMTLRPCRAESVNFDTTENLYIEGDNLDVLKLLRENYLGRVKMIYIDPPYNTGSDFIYEDDFSQAVIDYLDNSGQSDEYGNRLFQNTESNGRFHTDWLNMIYPRLKVAKDLLRDDGILFTSIDDNEIDNLKKVLDEIFGINNRLGIFIINSTPNARDYGHIGKMHEYCLLYSKDVNRATTNMLPDEDKHFKYSDSNGGFNIHPLYNSNEAFHKGNRPNLYYPFYLYENEKVDGLFYKIGLEKKVGAIEIYPPKSLKNQVQFVWRWGKDKALQFMNKEIVGYKVQEGEYRIVQKMRHSEKIIRSLLLDTKYSSRRGTAEVEEILDGKIFSFPKPLALLRDFVKVGSEEGSTIMDFFSGSATTAHAVMQLNSEDGFNRRFIMVQLPEPLDKDSEAYKAGYKNICEIGKERIRRAGKHILDEQKKAESDGGLFAQTESKPKVDVGFRVLKLDSSNMQDVYYRPEDSNEATLFEDNIKPDRTPEDLLFQVMLECNLPLSAKIETKKIADKDVFSVNNDYLIACFDTDVDEEVIKAVAKMKPYYFIMRDSSLSSDNVADNFDQIFQAYSKETIRRVL